MSPTPAAFNSQHVEPKHDFLAKLLQPSVFPHLRDYILWQVATRKNPAQIIPLPERAPISINLDLTSACNYGCAHCVDKAILNTGEQYEKNNLYSSLDLMHRNGLRSVIVIGGGEPTLYKGFTDLVRFLKERNISIGVVSNGTGVEKIFEVADLFTHHDWIRLSLDAGTDHTFQVMHKPKGTMVELSSGNDSRESITLERICENVRFLKSHHPSLTVGFSYIVTWPGAHTNHENIKANLEEISLAAGLAQRHHFSYLALKSFLNRTEGGYHAETIPETYRPFIEAIRAQIQSAQALETSSFAVSLNINLRALLQGTEKNYLHQPRECHMTSLRQVLGIRGIALCPVYRAEKSASLGARDAYSPDHFHDTLRTVGERIKSFDAKNICSQVVCMYNDTNWFIEDLINQELTAPGTVASLQPTPELGDYFL